MTPFYFGTRERRIFGIYEPAAPGTVGKRAAVLCHPWGAEYLHAHRAMRQLAIRLSIAGYHTLRFDPFGTGDSGGDMTDADLAGWHDDVHMALEELREIVGMGGATLIGLRLGATIATNVAASLPDEIDALVLWDPIIRGEDYLADLGVALPNEHAGPAAASSNSARTIEVQGFPLTTDLVRDIRSIDLRSLIIQPPARTFIVVTDGSPSHAVDLPVSVPISASAMTLASTLGRPALSPHAPSAPEAPTIEFMTAACPWIEDTANTGVVPVNVINRIVSWLA
jgi:pimeloyl-ACP methyl ester carboxylesterase